MCVLSKENGLWLDWKDFPYKVFDTYNLGPEIQSISCCFTGLEAFETHNVVRRTPELGDDSTRDSLTPTNDWKTDAADEGAGQIVDIPSKDVDLDRYTRDEQAYANNFLPIDKPQIRNVDSEVTRNSPRQTIQHSAHGLQPIQDSRRGERRDTEGSRDDDVEGMIEEGIRQVHEEELLEENEEENDTVQKEDRYRNLSIVILDIISC